MRKTGSVRKGLVAPDIQAEREKLAFDQVELSTYLAGGQERENKWKGLVDSFGADPGLRNYVEFADFTPHEQQVDLWKRIGILYKKHPELFSDSMLKAPFVDWIGYFQGLLPGIGLTISMFRFSVENFASAEQKARWMPAIQNIDILGCYGQTEIGHGSNVAGLLTTATLDRATDQFVINTPCIEATKYWPGDLGRFCSHAIIFARLIVDENDYGVQPFMVQMRDIETWKLFPGVKAGDLGPKIGYNSKDNGWASFDNVRIPRTDMLMGLCELSKDGDFSLKGDIRVLYSVMMGIRMMIVSGCGPYFSIQAARNATRYCTVRRQFKTEQGTTEERKVIDYQTVSTSIAKLLSRGITMTVCGLYTASEYEAMMKDISNQVFTRMDPMHHILSGFKSTFSNQALADVEEARRLCGGAGYQSFSGFTALFSAVSPMPTYEGENNVMLGQASRYLVKQLKRAKEGKKMAFPFEYLGRIQQTLALKNQGRTVEDFLNLDLLESALEARASNLITATMADYEASTDSSKFKDNDSFQQAKLQMTLAHLRYLQLHIFRGEIRKANFRDARITQMMDLVGKIFALEQLLEDGAGVYDTGFLAPGSYRTIQRAMEQCVTALRPQFLNLGETPYFPDHMVPSTIANSYGDIYEMQLEYAQKSRLNINNEVPEYFESLIKPILKSKLSSQAGASGQAAEP